MRCQNDPTTSHEVWNDWWVSTLPFMSMLMLPQGASPDNWLARCGLIFLNSSNGPTHEVEQFQRISSRSYGNGTNNDASKMLICTRSLNHASDIATNAECLIELRACSCIRTNIEFGWMSTVANCSCTWASCMLSVQESLLSTTGQTTNFVGSPSEMKNTKIPVERLSN